MVLKVTFWQHRTRLVGKKLLYFSGHKNCELKHELAKWNREKDYSGIGIPTTLNSTTDHKHRSFFSRNFDFFLRDASYKVRFEHGIKDALYSGMCLVNIENGVHEEVHICSKSIGTPSKFRRPLVEKVY